jgi:repressor LexA
MRDSERRTLTFIQQFVAVHGYSPKLHEICEGIGIHSKGTVSRYINELINQGLLAKEECKSRGLILVGAPLAAVTSLPLMGAIAAGKPIEALPESETFDFSTLLGEKRYILKVRGSSMQDEGILDGDLVICAAQDTAHEGEIVVALIDGQEVTLKRFYREGKSHIKLVPANASMSPLVIESGRVQIQGVFKGLIRVP